MEISRNLRNTLAVTAALAMVMLLASCERKEAPPGKKETTAETRKLFAVVGSEAPSFTLKSAEGKEVSLADFQGKPVVIDFWATWCGPCRESMHELEKLHREYKGKGVVFLGISMDEGEGVAGRVRTFAKENGLTYLLLIDNQDTSRAYGVRSVPATFILDRRHILVKTYPGYLPELGKMISGDIEGLLK